jgi:hypothetical protein
MKTDNESISPALLHVVNQYVQSILGFYELMETEASEAKRGKLAEKGRKQIRKLEEHLKSRVSR